MGVRYPLFTRGDAEPRLAAADGVYWFVREAFDWSIVLQLLWRFDSPLDAQALHRFNLSLGDGGLNRRLIRPVVPFARPRWVQADETPEIVHDLQAIADHSIQRWALDEMGSVPLDPETGPSYRLRVTPTESGGTAMSLCVLHLVADGRAIIESVRAARAGLREERVAGDRESRFRRVVRDSADAAAVFGQAGAGLIRLLGDARPSTDTAADASDAVSEDEAVRPKRLAIAQRSPTATPRWATVSVDRTEWRQVATQYGGTDNTLFTAVVSGLLRSSGYAPIPQPVKVGIPVSVRTEGDDSGNATAGVSIVLTDEPRPGSSLATIRARSKAAFITLSNGKRGPIVHLQPLLGLLPTSLVVKAVTVGSGMPDALASNVGTFDDEILELGGHRASIITFRGVAQGVDPHRDYRFGDGVQAWLVGAGETLTFSVAAFDELSFPSDEALCRLLSDELNSWGIAHQFL